MTHKENPQENVEREEDVTMESIISAEQEQTLRRIWQNIPSEKEQRVPTPQHITDALLYDLALGKSMLAQEDEARIHITTCDECRHQLVEFQESIARDKEIRAVWAPKVLQAAGGTQPPSVIKDSTTDRKYVITLQPIRDTQKDLLTLKVTALSPENFEGREIFLISSKGSIIFHGTISGGTVTRRVDRKFREERPFRVQAG